MGWNEPVEFLLSSRLSRRRTFPFKTKQIHLNLFLCRINVDNNMLRRHRQQMKFEISISRDRENVLINMRKYRTGIAHSRDE